MQNVSQDAALKAFLLNDVLKLVKVCPVSNDFSMLEVGFELWAEAWNKYTFFAFMDMLVLSIDHINNMRNNGEISFTSNYMPLE